MSGASATVSVQSTEAGQEFHDIAAGAPATARVVGVQDDLIELELTDDAAALVKNEVVYILPSRKDTTGRQERLKAEILRVRGRTADAQVYESTRGVAVGDPVEQSGEMLSVSLGPGLLGQVYDGLQAPLAGLAEKYGVFLPRGAALDPLDRAEKWAFSPSVQIGDAVKAGDILGKTVEGRFDHKIMVPLDWRGGFTVSWVREDAVKGAETVARLKDENGVERDVGLYQTWPVRRALNGMLLKTGQSKRRFPSEPVATTQRLIDTFFPIARGGTACIPGPFGAGKTVLQNLISRFSDVDIVIVVACGERAGEVVETISDFPKQIDPVSGGSLMDRTIIICNTSSMPVAAREASIYTGVTLGEYYRQMGLDVLLIADSTSRWAQAMRETSGRLEEIPGEEGFPAYLESSIKGIYERAGFIETNDGALGSLTIIGTVSPAGGNFDEPVTQATLSTVKCFLGLSSARAYKRFYPAVDPLLSWSRYLEQLRPWYDEKFGAGWVDRVAEMSKILKDGEGVEQMMQVTGEEGVTADDYVTYQKSLLLDMAYLQQDAFDAIDASAPADRQRLVFDKIYEILTHRYDFPEKSDAREYFTKMTRLWKNFNYSADQSPDFDRLLGEIDALYKST
ncbi:MAG: V-type ATP synthase subunit A [Pseudomonadota bacterium]